MSEITTLRPQSFLGRVTPKILMLSPPCRDWGGAGDLGSWEGEAGEGRAPGSYFSTSAGQEGQPDPGSYRDSPGAQAVTLLGGMRGGRGSKTIYCPEGTAHTCLTPAVAPPQACLILGNRP
jgi:hypothetical protein